MIELDKVGLYWEEMSIFSNTIFKKNLHRFDCTGHLAWLAVSDKKEEINAQTVTVDVESNET